MDHSSELLDRVVRPEKPSLATELWFSATAEDIEDVRATLQGARHMTTVRLGDRTAETLDPKQGYAPGQFVDQLILKPDGGFDDERHTAIVRSTITLPLGELANEHLINCLLDGGTVQEIRERLQQVYNREIGDDELITIIEVLNADNPSAQKLLDIGMYHVATQPQGNPQELAPGVTYTLPLLVEDYPAKTAAMWKAAYTHAGMHEQNVMLVGDPSDIPATFAIFRHDPLYQGGGMGVGFKEKSVTHLDSLSPLAEAIGAVNFVEKTSDGKLRGHNTDGIGYAQSLEDLLKERVIPLEGAKAVILGAGGTGNAVAFALAERGMEVVILNRTVARATELAEKINTYLGRNVARFGSEDMLIEEAANAAAIINVSTKGAAGELAEYSALAPAVLPATPENIEENRKRAREVLATLRSDIILSDVVLTKGGTPLLNEATAAGFTTLDGIPMVINQGVEAFWILYSAEMEAKGITKETLAQVMRDAAFTN